MKYKRLTTNNPINDVEVMLNYAYDNDKEVYLRYANGEEKRLAEYMAELSTEKGCERTAEDILEGACAECDCEVAVLNIVAIQAAELRHRLAELEDRIENGTLVELPCKVGDNIYVIALHTTYNEWGIVEEVVSEDSLYLNCVEFDKGMAFFDKSAAEAKLKELRGEDD